MSFPNDSDMNLNLLKNIFDHLVQLGCPLLKHSCFSKFTSAIMTDLMLRSDFLLHMLSAIDPAIAEIVNEGLGYEDHCEKIKLLTGVLSTMGLCRTDGFDLVKGKTDTKSQMEFLFRIFKLMDAIDLTTSFNGENDVQTDDESLYVHEKIDALDQTISSLKGGLLDVQKGSGCFVKKLRKNDNKESSSPVSVMEELKDKLMTLNNELEIKRNDYENIVRRGLCVCDEVVFDENESEETRKLASYIGVDCGQAKNAFMEAFDMLLLNLELKDPPTFDLFTKTIIKSQPRLQRYLMFMDKYKSLSSHHKSILSCRNLLA